MFSGIVEEMGSVASLVKNDKVTLWDGSEGAGVELTVKANTVLDGATEGCSIAVNGVCLTVTSFDGEEFKVAQCIPGRWLRCHGLRFDSKGVLDVAQAAFHGEDSEAAATTHPSSLERRHEASLFPPTYAYLLG